MLARHERARAGGAEPNSWAPSPCGRQAMRGARTQAHPPRRARGRYLNALQTNAQHLLRYLAVAVVVNKRRRNVLKELIRAVEQQARGAAPRCPRRLPHPWAARGGHRWCLLGVVAQPCMCMHHRRAHVRSQALVSRGRGRSGQGGGPPACPAWQRRRPGRPAPRPPARRL